MMDQGGIDKATEQAKETASHISESAKQAMRSARERADEQWSNVQRLGEEQMHRIQERVQHYPLSSVLFAAGIGFLLGVTLRGRIH